MSASAAVEVFKTLLRQCVVWSMLNWISSCAAGKFDNLRDRDDFIQVYTHLPMFPPLEKEYKAMAKVWIIILSVVGAVVILITCLFCYYALTRRRLFGRQQRNPHALPPPTLVPPPSAPSAPLDEPWNRVSTRSEGPPQYSDVVLGVHMLGVPDQKQLKAETPPPDYITVAPFQ